MAPRPTPTGSAPPRGVATKGALDGVEAHGPCAEARRRRPPLQNPMPPPLPKSRSGAHPATCSQARRSRMAHLRRARRRSRRSAGTAATAAAPGSPKGGRIGRSRRIGGRRAHARPPQGARCRAAAGAQTVLHRRFVSMESCLRGTCAPSGHLSRAMLVSRITRPPEKFPSGSRDPRGSGSRSVPRSRGSGRRSSST